MPFITFTVTGLNEVIGGLNKILGDMRTTKQTVLRDTSDFMVQELKRNAHVISGDMRDSCRSQMVTDSQYLVEVGVPYAYYENRRRGVKVSSTGIGLHNFADRAELATRDRFSQILVSAYGQMFHSL